MRCTGFAVVVVERASPDDSVTVVHALSSQVVLFMKGTKEEPRCGFSNTCVQIFNSMAVPFESVGDWQHSVPAARPR